MTTLVEIKQLIKSIYVRYELWITPLWKFLLSFLSLSLINSHVGYLSAIKPTPIVLMCALLCSFMPTGFMVFISSFFILGHFYAVSIETLGVTLVLFLLMFLLYFRFGPGDTVVLMLMPMLFLFKIPYLMPLALGLVASPVSVAAMSCGTVIYYLLSYVQTNATTMGASSVAVGEDTEIVVQLRSFLTGFMMNRGMWVTVAAFAAVLIVVYLIRRLPVDHAWKAAILVGAVLNLILLMVGDFMYDTRFSFVGVVAGTLISALLCFILEFFFFQLDYSRTERVQFEDDEYFYYVKAVPKVTLAEPERRVKKINRAHNAAKPVHHTSSAQSGRRMPEPEDEEDEMLRERVPSRTASRPMGAADRTRSVAGRTAAGRAPVRTAGATVRQPGSATRSVSGAAARPAAHRPAPAASTRSIPRTQAASTDEMPDRVLRVNKDINK
ncbi:MAG: hypothetical protein K5696_02645 [Lachnospiraceae bacterium]|nr:hypothetical protein [Lachnospiraceae bacterium]